jgi:hypothetical protein
MSSMTSQIFKKLGLKQSSKLYSEGVDRSWTDIFHELIKDEGIHLKRQHSWSR